MSTSQQGLAPLSQLNSSLWCRAVLLRLCSDPSAVMHLIVGDSAVPTAGRSIGSGQVRVGTTAAWRWPSEERDMVGELVIHHWDCSLGVQFVGWWSRSEVQPHDPRGAHSVLQMDIAGITLWESPRHASTEDSALIAALLR